MKWKLLPVWRKWTVTTITGVLFVSYWLITLLYVMPDNPFRSTFSRPLGIFERYAYQKWTFFAPPPQFNDRLVITYTNKLTLLSLSFDPLRDVLSDKRNAGIFNVGQEAMDYLISGAADQVSRITNSPKYRLKNPKKEQYTIDSQLDFPGLNSLKAYAAIVAKAHNLPVDEEVVVITDYADYLPEVQSDGTVLPAKTSLRFVTTPFRLQQ